MVMNEVGDTMRDYASFAAACARQYEQWSFCVLYRFALNGVQRFKEIGHQNFLPNEEGWHDSSMSLSIYDSRHIGKVEIHRMSEY